MRVGIGVGRKVGGRPALRSLPNGYIWPSQANPVSYDRSIPIVWGDRWEGADATLYDQNKWRLTLSRDPWSFASSDNDEIIFEVRSGDRYGYPVAEGGWTDPDTSERSEIQSVELVPNTWNWNMGWRSKIAGPTNTAPWCNLLQMFARNGGSGLGSPPVALSLESGDSLKLITRHGNSGAPTETYRHSFAFPRDTWVEFWLEGRWSTTGDGFCRLYINNSTAIEAENINLGYTTQTHWEPTVGVYRSEAPETLRHHLRAMQVSW